MSNQDDPNYEIFVTLAEISHALQYLREQLVFLVPASGWQPIKTAPKDGKIVLLSVPDEALPRYAFWKVDRRYVIGGSWADADGRPYVYPDATHWQPLPVSPVVLADQEEKK